MIMPIVNQALMQANRFVVSSLSPTQLEELTKTLEDEGVLSHPEELAEDTWEKESIYYLENPYHSLDNYIYSDAVKGLGKHQKPSIQRKKEAIKRHKRNKNKKTHRKK